MKVDRPLCEKLDPPEREAHLAAHMMSGGRVRAATRRVEDALLHEYDHLARRTGGTTSRAALLAKKYGFASETTVRHKLARARERRSTAKMFFCRLLQADLAMKRLGPSTCFSLTVPPPADPTPCPVFAALSYL